MNTRKQKLSLTLKEELLILVLRNKWKHGEVVIYMRDGQPVRVLKAFEGDDLDN